MSPPMRLTALFAALELGDGLAWTVGGCYLASAALFWRAGALRPEMNKES